jgi:hypothetical protein
LKMSSFQLTNFWDRRGDYVCHSSELAPPPPLPARKCAPPLEPKGGSNTRLRVRGRGEPIRTTGEKAWHSDYFVIGTLGDWRYDIEHVYIVFLQEECKI